VFYKSKFTTDKHTRACCTVQADEHRFLVKTLSKAIGALFCQIGSGKFMVAHTQKKPIIGAYPFLNPEVLWFQNPA
jgi:hypothetical protein